MLFTVPRYLQKFASHVLVSVQSATPLKRAAYACSLRFARPYTAQRWEGRTNLAQNLLYRILQQSIFKPILNNLGLDQLELVISGGAALPPETMALWHMYGVNVLEIYGQTEEAGGIISGQRGPFPKPGSVGAPVDGLDVKLVLPDGEVLVRGPDPVRRLSRQ